MSVPTLNQLPVNQYSRILGLGAFRPDVIVTNEDVCQWIDSSDEWIRQRTGIITRHRAPADVSVIDMAEGAAREALAKAGIEDAKRSIRSLGGATSEASKRASDSIDRYVKRLEMQAATTGKTVRELRRWSLNDAEVYEDILFDGARHCSIASVPGMERRTIIVSGVSKSYAMTGWRCGWTIAPKEVVAASNALQSHSTSNVCSITQRAVEAGLLGPQD